jgi:hypothetical protein
MDRAEQQHHVSFEGELIGALVDSPTTRHELPPRRSGIGTRLAIQVELAEEPGESDARIALNRNLRASARLAEPIVVNRPMYGDCLSRPLRPVPSLSGERKQPDVMLVKIEVAQHA